MQPREYEGRPGGGERRSYQKKDDGLDGSLERPLDPKTAAQRIRDIIHEAEKYGNNVGSVGAEVYRDYKREESCRHHGCGGIVAAKVWTISTERSDGGVYLNTQARWRFACPEMALHGMEVHDSFRSQGNITGVNELFPYDLRRVLYPGSPIVRPVDLKRGRPRSRI